MRDHPRGSNQTGELSRPATKTNSAIIRGFNGANRLPKLLIDNNNRCVY
jgi:hypothetical protein